jgi:hypothetical protein
VTDDLAVELADRLRDAHRRIAALDLPEDEKISAARRLIALSDTAKSDLGSASRRLDRLLADLDEGGTVAADGDQEAP